MWKDTATLKSQYHHSELLHISQYKLNNSSKNGHIASSTLTWNLFFLILTEVLLITYFFLVFAKTVAINSKVVIHTGIHWFHSLSTVHILKVITLHRDIIEQVWIRTLKQVQLAQCGCSTAVKILCTVERIGSNGLAVLLTQ